MTTGHRTTRQVKIKGDRWNHEERYLPFAKLGTYFENGVSSTEALVKANLDYEYQVDSPEAHYRLPDNEDFRLTVNGPYKAIVRPPVVGKYDSPEWIANVSDRYTLVQNREVAEFIEPLSQKYPVKVAGDLGGGRAVFYVLAGQENVDVGKGEVLNTYILVKDGKDGHYGLSFGLFAVRIKCMNMQMFSKKIMQFYQVRHTESIRDNIEIISNAFTRLADVEQSMLILARTYAGFPIAEKERDSIFESAYPMPKMNKSWTLAESNQNGLSSQMIDKLADYKRTYDVGVDRSLQMQSMAREVHKKFCEENTQVAGTIWSALQAVTELSTWREGSKADSSILFGTRAYEVWNAYEQAKIMVSDYDTGSSILSGS